ncbi:hypothetical protein GF351_02515 [Candidatus Woesearchaeota archaeon]|nr:hypothetical protein [Candidatus Woesearchaeota archaeon]
MVGNISNNTQTDVLRCFLVLEKGYSRQQISKELELGEGTVKSILNTLKQKNLITSSTHGHIYTGKGAGHMARIREIIELPRKLRLDLFPGKQGCAVLLKSRKEGKVSIDHRDLAIKNGADAALILVYGERLQMTGCDVPPPEELTGMYEYRRNNILIVCFSKTYRWAENSALATASHLSDTAIMF